MSGDQKKRPEKLGTALGAFLARRGLDVRLEPLRILEEWPGAVGPRIATVTRAVTLEKDGTLIVEVRTHAWMQELTLLERDLLLAVRTRPGGAGVTRQKWRFGRG